MGDKINYVYNAITQSDISKQTSQASFKKVFEPITTKLDDVVASDLKIPPMRRKTKKKEGVPNYGLDIEDEVEDMNLGDLFEPENTKQIVPKPQTYEESLKDVLEGKKEIYVDSQCLSQEPQEMPTEYDDDEVPDYEVADEDMANKMLDDIGVTNYDDVEMRLNQTVMTPQKNKAYLDKIIKNAELRRNELKGYQSAVTKQYKKGSNI